MDLKFAKVKYVLPCFFFILLVQTICTAQAVGGTVYGSNGEKIENVFVSVRKISAPNLIFQFTTTNTDGYYEISLKSSLDSIIVHVSTIDYEPQQKFLFNVQNSRKHTIDFNLEERTTELKEVIIDHNQPVVVRNDTVTYDPNAFKDGTERVIEDLIKKLPGMKVGENGEIKYKGKSIKKFLLDGDDLFDSEYTIGSRNISVDMVDQVQAVENYIDNQLLKDVVDSEDAALNIVLKKGKTDFSGNAELGYGISDKYDMSVTGLVINKRIKGFGIASYNNIGDNPTPYDFSSEIVSVGQNADKRLLSPQLLQQGNFYSELEDKYHRINDNLYINSNFLYKLSGNTKVRVGAGFYDDRLKRTNISRSEYSVNEESFVVNEVEKINKEPRLYNVNWQVLHKLSESQSLEYIGKLNYEDINYFSNSINNELLQSNVVNTANFFTKHNLNFTKRINEKTAFVTSGQYSRSRSPQHFMLIPGVILNGQSDIIESDQSSKFEKEYLTIDAEYYVNLKQNTRFQFGAGYRQSRTGFNSGLSGINGDNEIIEYQNFNNDIVYKVSVPYIASGFGYSQNNFYAGASVSAQYFNFAREDKASTDKIFERELIFVPSLNFKYKFSKKSVLTASYTYNQTAPREENMFEGIVMTNYRNFINNQIDIRFLKTQSYALGYRFNDFYKLSSFNVLLSHTVRDNNYSFKTVIDPYVSTITNFLLDASTRDYGLNINAEKYTHFMRTTWQMNANFSIAQNKNIVNESDLRDIETRVIFSDLTGRTGFQGFLNFENKVSVMYISSYAEGFSKNNYTTLTNSFKAILKIRHNLKASANLNYISPDTSLGYNYWFLDSELRLISKSKKLEYSLIGRNLTNNKEFSTVLVSDYARSLSSHNLIQRFLLLKIGFTF